MAVFKAKKQYPYLITQKFNVPFSWFQPEPTSKLVKSIFWLVQKSVIVYCECFPNIQFSGSGITAANLYLMNENNADTTLNKNNSYLSVNLAETVANNKGAYGVMNNKIYGTGQNTYKFIENRVTGQELFLRLNLNINGSINDLTQGEFSLWITSSRNI